MALTPTEREEHFFKAMVDAADGSTPEELEPTERKEHWYKEIIDAIVAGGGGSGGGVLVVTDTDGTLDKTWQEIKDAMLVGSVVIDRSSPLATDMGFIASVFHTNIGGQYLINAAKNGGTFVSYTTASASGYPTVVSAGGGGND